MRFLCDEMLAGLGRWLRAAGYDAAIVERGSDDRRLLARAAAEGRIVLSRDSRLAEHRAAAGRLVVLAGNDIDTCARELRQRLGIDWLYRPFTRCLVCNVALEPAGEAIRRRLPPAIRTLKGAFTLCPKCGRLYWPGSHVRRMRRRLEEFAGREWRREE